MRIAIVIVSLVACSPAARWSPRTSGPPTVQELLVSTQQTCPAAVDGCDILEIIDLHTDATSEDKGFDELRELARRRGGDAVIGAEFEHGEDDERSHLSGMIVRYSTAPPPHAVLGDVEIASDPDDQAKGLDQLMVRAAAMGGDQVIGVTFEHGENGGAGRLRGQVIRSYR